jgi:hypothetical protein
MKRKIGHLILKIFLFLLLGISAVALFVVLPIEPPLNPLAKIGVTFSPRAATFLGLNWKQAYIQMLSDLDPDVIRIPIYWNVLEAERDRYDWSDFDFQLQALENRDTEIILAIGHKLPRWPECHIPEWAKSLQTDEVEAELFEMVEDVVRKYKDHPNVTTWQVQNEVLFPFGECPEWSGSRDRLKRLIQLVQSLDTKNKVTTSDSGELSLWLKTSTLPIDALEISLYRAVYDESHDYFYWPTNPYFYKLHAFFVRPFVDDIIISELQMEPWGPAPVDELGYDDIYRSFSPLDFDERLDFAQRTGASTILTWGVEWWYYMKEVQDNPLYWDRAIKYFQN